MQKVNTAEIQKIMGQKEQTQCHLEIHAAIILECSLQANYKHKSHYKSIFLTYGKIELAIRQLILPILKGQPVFWQTRIYRLDTSIFKTSIILLLLVTCLHPTEPP